ncbi:MAG: EthD domain-containing protein [Minwuia sp.]|uniref:EthD domain-containing protein n=1 Tax=Minwuia sp. TaxID=2493630 RepID=UPI003A8B3262
MIKITFCLKRKPGLTLKEFHDYWLNHHGPLVRKHQKALRMVRYVQVHAIETALSAGMQKARKAPEGFDGVAELWWESVEELEKSLDDPAAREAGRILLEDEAKFIDLPNSPLWFGEEHVVVGDD